MSLVVPLLRLLRSDLESDGVVSDRVREADRIGSILLNDVLPEVRFRFPILQEFQRDLPVGLEIHEPDVASLLDALRESPLMLRAAVIPAWCCDHPSLVHEPVQEVHVVVDELREMGTARIRSAEEAFRLGPGSSLLGRVREIEIQRCEILEFIRIDRNPLLPETVPASRVHPIHTLQEFDVLLCEFLFIPLELVDHASDVLGQALHICHKEGDDHHITIASQGN